MDPRFDEAYNNRGYAWLVSGNLDSAITDLDKAETPGSEGALKLESEAELDAARWLRSCGLSEERRAE